MIRPWPKVVFWTVPSLFLFILYAPALHGWFQADDFAWLTLERSAHDTTSFIHAIFAPKALGTFRPWSERGFFFVFDWLFGLNTVPWHLFVFMNACGCVLLLQAITFRVTCSFLAGWIAPLAWTVSTGLPVDLSWLCAYNEILCSLFLLSALWFRIRGLFRWELVIFILGFGALELNVIYPAIALAWVLLGFSHKPRKQDLREVLSLGLVAALYLSCRALWIHKGDSSGVYALFFDTALIQTFKSYWVATLVAPPWAAILHIPRGFLSAAVLPLTLCLGYLVFRARRFGIFGFAWYLLTLVPLLPLKNHISVYYLCIPCIGIGLVLGAAASTVKGLERGLALGIVFSLIAGNALCSRLATDWWIHENRATKTLVLGSVTAHSKHPGAAIAIDGISSDLYAATFPHDAFSVVGVPAVYLTPETAGLEAPSNLSPPEDYLLAPGPARKALEDHRVVIYSVSADRLQNITDLYGVGAAERLPDTPPTRVDAGNPLNAYLLGPGWYELENGHRWMSSHASLTIGAPQGSGNMLVVTGYCTPDVLHNGPLRMTVTLDGTNFPPVQFLHPEMPFVRRFPVSFFYSATSAHEVAISLDRTTTPPNDTRRLGLAFGVFEFRR